MTGFGNNHWQGAQMATKPLHGGGRARESQKRLMLIVVNVQEQNSPGQQHQHQYSPDALPDADLIFWLAAQFGITERVSTWRGVGENVHKNHIAVQFQNPTDCDKAILHLNGKWLPGVGFLRCIYSKMETLTFKNNDSRNRQYNDWNDWIKTFTVGLFSGLYREELRVRWQSSFGLGIVPCFPYEFIWGEPHYGMGDGCLYPPQQNPAQCSIPGMVANASQAESGGGCCLHVSGLPEDVELLGAGELFTLFGMIGAVVVVRLLQMHPGCANLQFASQAEASRVLRILTGEPLVVNGKKVVVEHSRQQRTMVPQLNKDVRRVCTQQDRKLPPFLPEAETHAPSPFLFFWDVPCPPGQEESMPREVKQLVREVPGMTGRTVGVAKCVMHKSTESTEGETRCSVSVECKSTDDAIMAACALNGQTYETDGGCKFPVKMCFTTDLAPLPERTTLHEREQQTQQQQHPSQHTFPSPGPTDVPPPPPPPPGVSSAQNYGGLGEDYVQNYHPGYHQNYLGYLQPCPWSQQAWQLEFGPHFQGVPGPVAPPPQSVVAPPLPVVAPPPQVQPIHPQHTPPLGPLRSPGAPPSPPESDEDSIGYEGEADGHEKRHPKTPAAVSNTASSFLEGEATNRVRSSAPQGRQARSNSTPGRRLMEKALAS